MYLADAFIQSDLQCIQAIHFCQNVHKHYDYESVLVPSGRGGNFRDGFAVTGDDGLTHIYFGGLRKCSDRMDVVVEDDYPHHDT